MNATLLGTVLLAGRERVFRNMGSGFREKKANFDPLVLLAWIAAITCAIVVLGLIVRAIARRRETELYNSPRGLFRGLCRAHRLTRARRKLLAQIARFHQLGQPALLFLEPARLDPDALGATFAPQRGEVVALRRRIFANSEPAELPASGVRQPSPAVPAPTVAERQGVQESPSSLLTSSPVPPLSIPTVPTQPGLPVA